MRYAGVQELGAAGNKAVTQIKSDCMGLRIQMHELCTLRASAGNEELEDGTADAASAPVPVHGHATDITVGQQAASANRDARLIQRQCMNANRIGVVPFKIFRDLLLNDKHPAPQILQHGGVITP